MSHASPSSGSAGSDTGNRPAGPSGSALWSAAGNTLAAVLMIVQGVFGILEGIAAVAKDDVYGHVGTYVFKFNLTAWGWIHIVLGALLVLVGIGVTRGAVWARVTGIVLAALAVIGNFMWLPFTPIWALIDIGVGLFVIWALCTRTRHEA